MDSSMPGFPVLHCLQSLLKLMVIESVLPFNYLILCHPLLFLPSIFPSINVFSSESALLVRSPKYWSFSICPSREYSGLISFRIDWLIFLQSKGPSDVFLSITIRKHCKSILCDSLQPHGLYSPPGSSLHGILQARILEWVAIFFSRGSSCPRDWTQVSCISGRFFTVWATREAHMKTWQHFIW